MSALLHAVAPPMAADRIKPLQRGKSGFFSWPLYQWLRRHPEQARIYRGNVHYPGALYIGSQEGRFLHGALLEVVALQGQTLNCWAFVDANKDGWEEITAEFWEQYLSKGVCAIFKNGEGHTYDVSGPVKTCLYCGEKSPLVHRRVVNHVSSRAVVQ